ncbi:Ig-like domain-containing protein [Shivajiella indica]|uniref:Ig-like domain-containing protein n=1 Tax=Shivajiella indica TaxID=872115 RepID=A0ABW5BBN9_9BACT
MVYLGFNQVYANPLFTDKDNGSASNRSVGFEEVRRLIFSQSYEESAGFEENLTELEAKVGEVIVFAAEPEPGFYFSHWEVNGQKVSEKVEFEYTMPNSDVQIVGIFKSIGQPSIRIASPADNSTFESNKDVSVRFEASSPNGNITKVELFKDGIIVGTVSDPRSIFTLTNLQIGSYVLTSKVTDDKGATAVSPQVEIEVVKPNVPPVVQIISPSDGSTYLEGSNIRFEAEALDSDGKISKVEFYRGSVLIGSSTLPPYHATISNAATGSYTITAKAFDEKNASAVSSPINIIVGKPNQLPTVSISSPKNGDKFIEGSDLKIDANAADSDGRITKVEFYRGSTLIGTSTTSPYSVIWTKPAAGGYALTAKAFDDKNATTTSQVINVTIEKPNVVPTVSITSPSSGAIFMEGSDIKIEANASDSDGRIVKVEFYNGNTLLGTSTTSPYSITWSKPLAGTYTLTAKAFDEKNATTVSAPRKIVVEKPNQLPNVTITSPKSGDKILEGTEVSIQVNASDADGTIIKVEFYNGTTLLGTVTTAPYIFKWDKPAAGNYTLTAKAFDNKNGATVSAAVNVTIEKPNVAPTVSITSPKNGDLFVEGTDIKIEANAADSDGKITKVEFYRSGTLIGTSTTAPYSITWSKAFVGKFALTAKAFDDKNASTVSSVVNIEVEKENVPPTVSISAPLSGSKILEGSDVKIKANAVDSDGRITKVEFYKGSTLIGTSTIAPYVVSWPNVELGTYTLTAKAFDNKGASRTSAPVSVTVLPEQLIPEIEFISPLDNQTFEAGEKILMTVMFSGDAEHVKKVEYFSGDQLIGTSTESPFIFDWENATSGFHTIKAVATGGFPEKSNISSEVKITVKYIPFEIVNPIRNSTFPTGSDIPIMVQLPNDTDKAIKRVEYYRGNQRLGSNGKEPYAFIWKNVPQGEHNLVARLVFEDNSIVLSPVVKIFTEEMKVPTINLDYEILNPLDSVLREVAFRIGFEDLDVPIVNVEYFVNGISIGVADKDPFGMKWQKLLPGNYQVIATATDQMGNHFNSRAIDIEIPKIEPLRIAEIRPELTYVIGPNPTTDYLNIYFDDIDEESELEIRTVSMRGEVNKVYVAKPIGSMISIDVTDLNEGIYLLYINYKNEYYPATKFIKK